MTDEQIRRVFEYAREYRRMSVAEHEILLSFTNDDDAYAFYEWMTQEGEKAFLAYLKEMNDD